jgi:hypothetical protein
MDRWWCRQAEDWEAWGKRIEVMVDFPVNMMSHGSVHEKKGGIMYF